MTSLMDIPRFTIEADYDKCRVRSPGYLQGMDGVDLDDQHSMVTTLPSWLGRHRPQCFKECGQHASALARTTSTSIPYKECGHRWYLAYGTHDVNLDALKSVGTTLPSWRG